MSESLRSLRDADTRERRATIENPLGEGRVALGENDLTLVQIRDNPRLSDLFFNAHLNRLDPTQGQAVLNQMMADPPIPWTPEQRAFLESARHQFNEQMTMARLAREAITNDEISRMADRDPRIEEIIGATRNIEEAGRVLRSQIDSLATTDPHALEQLLADLRRARELPTEEESRSADRLARETTTRYGIGDEQYREAIRPSLDRTHGVERETEQRIEQLVRDNMGFLASLRIFGGNRRARNRAAEITQAFERQRASLHNIETRMRSVGTALLGTLDPDTRIAIQRTLRDGGTPEVRDNRNVVGIADYKSSYDLAQREYSDSAIERKHRAEIEKAARRLNKLPEQFTQAERDAIDEPFAQILAQEIGATYRERRASGLFATMLSWLFSKSVMEIRNKTRDHWNRVGAPATP